jgi:hypothetical protein
MAKTRKAFQDSLTLISLFGFLVIALNSFAILDLSQWQTAMFLIIAGGGLFVEGEGLTIRRWGRDGIQQNEVSKLLTVVVGIFSIVVGILSIPQINITTPQLESLTGLVAVFAFVFILLQRWVLD